MTNLWILIAAVIETSLFLFEVNCFLDLRLVPPAVTIKCPDDSDRKELMKKLPGTMTVQKLKGLLQRLYKVDGAEQKLTYLDERVS